MMRCYENPGVVILTSARAREEVWGMWVAWLALQSRLGMTCASLAQCSALGEATQIPQVDTCLRGPECEGFDEGSLIQAAEPWRLSERACGRWGGWHS